MKVRKNEFCESVFLIVGDGKWLTCGKNGKLNRSVSIGGDFDGKFRRLPRWRSRAAGVSVPQAMWQRQPRTFLQGRPLGKDVDASRCCLTAPRSALARSLQAPPRARAPLLPEGWRFWIQQWSPLRRPGTAAPKV